MNNQNFLPENYEAPASNSKYLKLQQGENKIRVLSSAIVGWEDWDNKTPVRTKTQPETLFDPNRPAKHFWAFVVLDYSDNGIKILEVTQKSIRDGILSLINDEDWGSPKDYDIKIKKTGQDLETRYTVSPVPHSELPQEIIMEYASTNINLEELFLGGDPFASKSVDVENIPMS